jgi:intraflagellar transport protein 46
MPVISSMAAFDGLGLDPDFAATIAAMFDLIAVFDPRQIDLAIPWKPFIPQLKPAIGVIDPFIKIPRPDGNVEPLGLVTVDEPSISQSNPLILKMHLRERHGLVSPDDMGDGYHGFVKRREDNRKQIGDWLEFLDEVHSRRPPPGMIYKSAMPDVHCLMEPWPDELEDFFASTRLSLLDMDLTFEEHAAVILAILDIPNNGNLVESLHCLFSLFAEFSANSYFR